MPVFQVILSTASGAMHELTLRAPDATTAAYIAGDEVGDHQPHTWVTHVCARHLGNGGDTTPLDPHRTETHTRKRDTTMTNNPNEVTLRSPDGQQTVRSSDPDEIREYESNGYERVTTDQQ